MGGNPIQCGGGVLDGIFSLAAIVCCDRGIDEWCPALLLFARGRIQAVLPMRTARSVSGVTHYSAANVDVTIPRISARPPYAAPRIYLEYIGIMLRLTIYE